MTLNLKEALLSGISTRSDEDCVGRYAPSPSGPLHLGNTQTALLAWLQIRLCHGSLYLRIDDLDEARTKSSNTEQIIDDLTWLGLDWDGEPYYQIVQTQAYARAFDYLVKLNKVYPCSCTRKEIASLASAPHDTGLSVRYPGTCRNKLLDAANIVKPLAWRYLVEDALVRFEDKLAGEYQQNLVEDVGDFILRRKDSVYAYQLASVVDDINLGVTDVVRGRDLLDSTPRQITLFNSLSAAIPQFWHVPLKLDLNGERMAKRNATDSLLSLREQGFTAAEVVGKLAYELGLIGENRPASARQLLLQLKAAP